MNRWFQSLYTETEVAKIITQQEIYGVGFDKVTALKHISNLNQLLIQQETYIRPFLKKICQPLNNKINGEYSYISKPFLKSGNYAKAVTDYYDDISLQKKLISGPFSKVSFLDIDISQREKLATQLIDLGWEPQEFSPKGQAKLTEKGEPVKSLERFGELGKHLALWFIYKHRLGVIQGLLENIRPDGRISAQADTLGTNTGRVSHKVVANIPRITTPYGLELREIFYNPFGFLLGIDAAGLEARVMAHYAYRYDGGELAKAQASGTIHDDNKDYFGISRDDAKTLYYALIYGAYPSKVCTIIGCSLKRGKEIYEEFWERNEVLAILRQRAIYFHNKQGYVPGLDGRKVFTRSEHSALNTIFQSAGAIIMKLAMILAQQEIKKQVLPLKQVIFYHDEFQYDILDDSVIIKANGEYKSEIGDIIGRCIIQAGEILKLNIALDYAYSIGHNWAETH